MKNFFYLFVILLSTTVYGQISANGSQIKDVADPTDAQDVTTKNYVDTSISNVATNPLDAYFPDGISLGDLISWVWDGNIWEPTFSQYNSSVLSLVSEPGTDTQIVCEFESMQSIQYAVSGDSSEMSVSGLPNGIGYTLLNGILTISGIANQDVSTQTTFNYTVTLPTQDSNVNTIASGTIVVTPKSALVLEQGELNQTACLGESIAPITFLIEGNAPNATVTGLPDGVTANIIEDQLIISGTPPEDLASGSRFEFTVQTNASSCAPDTSTGAITVTDCSTCYPTASAGADFSVCAGDAYTVQNASAANYTSLQWTTSGTGTFDSATAESPTYVPSNADIANQQITLSLTTTNDSCTTAQTVQDEMVLTLTQCNSIDVTLQNNDELELFGNAMTYGAQVVTNNMQNISQVGMCYSTSVAPTIDSATITEDNSGTDWWAGANPSYTLTASGLSPNTTYYVRAFAKTINDDVVYGDQVEVGYEDPNIAEVYNFKTSIYVNLDAVQYSRVTNLTYLNITQDLYLSVQSSAPTNRNILELRFPNLTTIDQLQIQNDMTIEQLICPNVNETSSTNQWFYIVNTALKSLSFPNLETFRANWLQVNLNNQLETIEMPNLVNWYNRGQIYIQNNDSLEVLRFPSLQTLESTGSNQNFSISNNDMLTLIDFPNLTGLYHKLSISSNPLLTEISIPQCVFLGKGSPSNAGLNMNNNNALQTLNIDALETVYNTLYINNNDVFNVAGISNCGVFVVNNDGYDCNFGTINISGNANNDYCFQDPANLQPISLITSTATDVTQTTATSGGSSLVAPNNTVMSRKGVCWSTAQNPTVADNLSDNGFGNDNFEAYIFGLLPSTTYHYRAYAEDCNGVYYGNEMSFTTPQ